LERVKDLFSSREDSALAGELSAVERDTRLFAEKYRGKMSALSGAQLGEAVEAYEKISERAARIASFVILTVTADNDADAWGQTVQGRLKPAALDLLFFPFEINRMKESDLLGKMSDSKLSSYGAWLRQIRSGCDHQLSDDLEKFIHDKASVAEEAWVRLYDMTVADLRFNVRGEEMTEAEALHLIGHAGDPALRREAYAELGRVFGENRKVFTLIANTLADLRAAQDEWRGFKNPEDSRHLSNQVETDVVDALVKAVRESYPDLSHRYYAWKAKKFGVARLHPADRRAPLPGDKPCSHTWDEAKDIVLKAYRNFSPEMADIGQKFFENRWIDAAARPGKDGGAACWPTVPSAHPYIIMNFLGSDEDINTLAHELGRGIHQSLAAEQGFLKSALPPTLEKTAGIFGEMLIFRARLDAEEDLVARRAMLARRVEDMLDTVVRQTAFHTFEQKLHQERRKKGELPPERISALWREMQQESLGPSVNLDVEGAENMWMNIPHFVQSPFHVYAYAFCDCVVNALYDEYGKTGDKAGFAAKYTDMLKAGGSKRHDEALAAFGLDAADPQFWEKGLSVLARHIDELEALDLKIESILKAQKEFRDTAGDMIAPAPPPDGPGKGPDPGRVAP
jgi:oligoendopeptidase F